MRYCFCIYLLLVVALSQGCHSESIELSTKRGENLEIQAKIYPKFRKFSDRESKIDGEIFVKNKTHYPQKFGNSFLFLNVNQEHISRTYKNTKASEVIDFSTVDIEPNSSISFPVYWVFSVPETKTVETLNIFYEIK